MIVPFVLTLASYRDVPYLWFFYKWLMECKKYGWPMIAQEQYFYPIRKHIASGYAEAFDVNKTARFGYKPPKSHDLNEVRHYPIPEEIFTELEKKIGTRYETCCSILTEYYEPLGDLIEKYIGDIESSYSEKIEAFVVLQHNPTLQSIADKHGIPVIHFEWGPFRPPMYLQTMYFDTKNLHCGCSVMERYERFKTEFKGKRLFTNKELLALMLLENNLGYVKKVNKKPKYKVGLALGYMVEEIYTCRRFYTDMELVYQARKHFARRDIAIRKHPGDPYGAQYKTYLDMVKEDGNVVDFILSCESIATVGSNVAIEAMYYGRGAYVIAPVSSHYAAAHSFDEAAKCADESFLNFFALCYLAPFDFMTDIEYIRWRLGDPSETEIFKKHLEYYMSLKGIPMSVLEEGEGKRLRSMMKIQLDNAAKSDEDELK